jgi:hypothetical protein
MQYKAEEKPIGKSTFRRDMEITIDITSATWLSVQIPTKDYRNFRNFKNG